MEQTRAAGTVINDASIGTIAWNNVNNVKVLDDIDSQSDAFINAMIMSPALRIIKDGVIGGLPDDGINTYTFNVDSVYQTISLPRIYNEGLSDYETVINSLWNQVLIPSDVNSSNFGVAVYFYNGFSQESNYINAQNFGFNIPKYSTIDGIVVLIKAKYSGSAPAYANVDYISITVHYTENNNRVLSIIST